MCFETIANFVLREGNSGQDVQAASIGFKDP